jgi:hypothetical protein
MPGNYIFRRRSLAKSLLCDHIVTKSTHISSTVQCQEITFLLHRHVITLNCTIPAYLASGLLIAFPCQSHADQTLQKPPKSSNPRPNLTLGALGRWQAFYSTRVNAGWPTTARVYLTKQKIRKVSARTKSFLSVNWNSQPCMAESSPKTLAPSSL